MDHVSGDTVMFRGADVVDGTPVLDIKPYIPYVDGGVDAQAPAWVSDHWGHAWVDSVLEPAYLPTVHPAHYTWYCIL